MKDFIDDSSSDESTSTSKSDDTSSNSSSSSVEKVYKKKLRNHSPDEEEVQANENAEVKNWWDDFIQEGDMDSIESSSKLHLFFIILKKCEEIGDKLLVFTQSLLTLDLIEYFLEKVDSESQSNESSCKFASSWIRGLDYFRLDGQTNTDTRASWCKIFNSEHNLRLIFYNP